MHPLPFVVWEGWKVAENVRSDFANLTQELFNEG